MSGQRRIAILGAAVAALAAGGMGVSPVPGAQTIVTAGQSAPAPQASPAAQATSAARRRNEITTAYGALRFGYRNWPPRTVAQDKRDARKRRNRQRHKRAMRRAGR